LKQLGSGGYMTYVKAGMTAAVIAGLVAAGAGLLYLLSRDKKTEDEEDRRGQRQLL